MAGKTAVVVGAGIVGVSVALWVQRSGHHVILLDRDEPGMGTSYGNACTFADYGCIPINSPGLFTRLPSLLWSGESPLRLDLFHALRHFRWTLDFLRHCAPSRVDRIIHALGALLSRIDDGLDPLVADSGAESLLRRSGCIYAYETRKAYERDLESHRKRAAQGAGLRNPRRSAAAGTGTGARHRLLPRPAVSGHKARHQPESPRGPVHAAFRSPGEASSGKPAQPPWSRACRVILENGERIPADTVVICAGAFSSSIHGAGTRQLPLDVERGYHVQFSGLESLLGGPVGWAEGGFYATPTSEGLRCAGTVEIASLDRPPTPERIAYLTRSAKRMFRLEEEPTQSWLGFRPTFPDALPVIGPSPASPDILLAFGHQHLGLTLAGITGMLISELMDGRQPSVDIAPYAPGRFA